MLHKKPLKNCGMNISPVSIAQVQSRKFLRKHGLLRLLSSRINWQIGSKDSEEHISRTARRHVPEDDNHNILSYSRNAFIPLLSINWTFLPLYVY
jgi:hypothetical protein